jgi:hypothetical protein
MRGGTAHFDTVICLYELRCWVKLQDPLTQLDPVIDHHSVCSSLLHSVVVHLSSLIFVIEQLGQAVDCFVRRLLAAT